MPEQTGSQYSHQYNKIIYYIRVPKGFGTPGPRYFESARGSEPQTPLGP